MNRSSVDKISEISLKRSLESPGSSKNSSSSESGIPQQQSVSNSNKKLAGGERRPRQAYNTKQLERLEAEFQVCYKFFTRILNFFQ